ncbi:MAG: VCBS repeat-containing protein [Myxococcota bacterium]
MNTARLCLAALLAPLLTAEIAEAKARFNKVDLSVPGQVFWLDWGDVDGDGLVDLVVAYGRGIGPEAQRFVGVFFRNPGGFSKEPDLKFQTPPSTAIFDLGDAIPGGGDEIVYMSRFGVYAQSLAGRRPANPVQIVRARTAIGPPEEEDFVRWDFLRSLPGGEAPVLIVPEGGVVELYRRDETGTWKRWSKVDVPDYAVYDAETTVYKPGRRGGAGSRPFSLKITTVIPTMTFIDQTGDGKPDLVANYRDRVAVFPMKSDGTLTSSATYSRWFEILTPEEQSTHDSELTLDVGDLDGDGIADVSVSKIGGGLTTLKSETRIYLGKPGGGFGNAPVQTFKEPGFATLSGFHDLDGDGKVEMVHPYAEVTVLGMSKVLLSSKLTLELRFRRRAAGPKLFEDKPLQTLEMVFGLDYATGAALRGSPPIFGYDFDGDGRRDALLSAGSEAIELHRGLPPGGELIFDEDSSATLSAPVSRETYAIPQKTSANSKMDVLVSYVDHPKMTGRLLLFLNEMSAD